MLKRSAPIVLGFILFLGLPVLAKTPFQILFIGNSLTYYPSPADTIDPDPTTPYLPQILKRIIESKHANLDVSYEANTRGGFSFEAHFNDSHTKSLLKKKYDAVVLQSHSIEALDLPKWFKDNGYSYQEKFFEFGERLIKSSATPTDKIYLYAPWAYHAKHPYFDPAFPGLRFEKESTKAGLPWFGHRWDDVTDLIERSYLQLARNTSAHVAPVGRAWLEIQKSSAAEVTHDQLYWELKSDFKHPGYKGSYLAACVLYSSMFNETPHGAAFEAERLSQAQAIYLQDLSFRSTSSLMQTATKDLNSL